MGDVIAVTGASGFIGRRLLQCLNDQAGVSRRVLVRKKSSHLVRNFNAEVVEGDMQDSTTFERLVCEGCVWINLAQLEMPAGRDEASLMTELVAICRRRGVKRVVHCSTAVVVGRTRVNVVTERTACLPGNPYEARKHALETVLLRNAANSPEVTVLRPTAVFGPGGRNLIKLADDLQRRAVMINYLKSCIQGHRRMNLVHVDNVVAALVFLATARADVTGEIFIVSDDEYPANNYRDVERALMSGLSIPTYPISPVAMPPWTLSFALRVIGRTNISPSRIYDCSKILSRGFKKPISFSQGMLEFVDWYRQNPPPRD
jgi:nucleoside-diphosphate-sugar epimerase